MPCLLLTMLLKWSESWLKNSRLKNTVNTPLLAAGCFITDFSAAHGTHLGNINFNHSIGIYEGRKNFS